MSVKPKEVDNAWKKLGFKVDKKARDIKATLWVDGKVVLRTKRSHGAKGTSGMIPHFIRQQMRLNEDQFADALACPLDQESYFDLLREKGHLAEAPSSRPSDPAEDAGSD